MRRSYTDAPLPDKPEAKMAAWVGKQEERVSRLENGGIFIPIHIPMGPGILTSEYVLTGSDLSTFVNGYKSRLARAYYDAVEVIVPASSPAGTTGQVRLGELTSSATTSAATVTAGTSGTCTFKWLHGIDTTGGVDVPFELAVQFRRSAGTVADVLLFHPVYVIMAPAEIIEGAASNGAPDYS